MDCEAVLQELTEDIVRLLSPEKIILFNQKQNTRGELTAIKLCVIIPQGDARNAEHRLYMELESELPLDLLVYNRGEWQGLLDTPYSFAGRIRQTGRVLYEAD